MSKVQDLYVEISNSEFKSNNLQHVSSETEQCSKTGAGRNEDFRCSTGELSRVAGAGGRASALSNPGRGRRNSTLIVYGCGVCGCNRLGGRSLNLMVTDGLKSGDGGAGGASLGGA